MKTASAVKPKIARAKKVSKRIEEPVGEASLTPAIGEAPQELDAAMFRERLMAWYAKHARVLPWRGVNDPYATWLSEIMLQQTQVVTVQERFVTFLKRFPTLQALAAARENEVLALWSGMGYYRRARMLHKAAQFVARELDGQLPGTTAELKTLPGVGEYTAAAIASIAFGESVAVVDGNVERVVLRLTGQHEEKSKAARARVAKVAQGLVPEAAVRRDLRNPPGDHNQAMMELGATICTPRGPLCLQCPVVAMCRTRGEHVTLKPAKQKQRRVAHVLVMRERKGRTEVLLEQRAQDASLMAGMFELPPLPLEAVAGMEPDLRLRHAITNTLYSVEVYRSGEDWAKLGVGLIHSVPASAADLHWAGVKQLGLLPLTGLARKCLVRMGVMEVS